MQKNNVPASVQAAAEEDMYAVDVDKPTRRWYHWHEPGTSAEEKRLIFKLDAFILTYTCLVSLAYSYGFIGIYSSDYLDIDILDQVSRPDQCHQRLCVRHERRPQSWFVHILYRSFIIVRLVLIFYQREMN